jgi:uncharacterized protein YaaW (UPF0174 family)
MNNIIRLLIFPKLLSHSSKEKLMKMIESLLKVACASVNPKNISETKKLVPLHYKNVKNEHLTTRYFKCVNRVGL